jgi:hypothetical protein
MLHKHCLSYTIPLGKLKRGPDYVFELVGHECGGPEYIRQTETNQETKKATLISLHDSAQEG